MKRETLADSAIVSANNALIEKIMANVHADSIAFENSKMFSSSVKRTDGSYRTKKFDANVDFTFKGVTTGVRGQFIFLFTPLEPDDYEWLEIDEKKVFDVFDGFEQMLAVAIIGPEPCPADATWNSVKKAFLKTARDAFRKEEVATEKARNAELANEYSDNPVWGSW
jgi:hypothetical protein